MLTFEPDRHIYRWNGEIVPNVTRVLSLLSDWSKVAPAVLESARAEGVDIHRCVELYSRDDLDEDTLPEWLRPRLAAYKLFLLQTGFTVEASEARVYHDLMRYAGTADLFGTFERIRIGRGTRRMTANIDVKRSFIGSISIGLQTAAYSDAWHRMGNRRPDLRCALQLRADGTYRLQEYHDRADFSKFLHCLQAYRLREEMHA